MLITRLTFLTLFVAQQSWAQNTRGSFAKPKTGPKWRYWIEDGSADLDVLKRDVAEMARIGSSGFELLSYQSYGGVENDKGAVVVDPTGVAFGSDNFVIVTETLVRAAKANNITIDFTLGPNQGAGVPIKPEDVDQEGLLTELNFGSHFLKPGESFNGTLPPPFIVPFVAADGRIRSANVTEAHLIAVLGAQLVQGANPTAKMVSLDFNTVVDLTDRVQGSGKTSSVSWAPSANQTSVVLAYYYRRNGFPEAVGGFNGVQDAKPGSWGSFIVDHFSAKGVNISSTFIQNNILSRNGIGELLAEPGVGKYMWEDSMEFQAQVFWTPDFPQRFQELHGYSVNKALPVFHALLPAKPAFASGLNVNQTFDYGSTSNAWAFTEDYRDTLTTLYMDYMQAFNEWSNSIGLQFSNQPGYNYPLDVGASAPIPDVPEIESLGFPTIDQARELSGGVHLGKRPIFSSETGARRNVPMALTMAQLLEDSKGQFASHVNLLMLHGYSYSGTYPKTTWPGLCTFAYNFAEMHGPRMPAWDHYDGYMSFLARNQYILQNGVPKVDIALYRRAYDATRNRPSPFPSDSLIHAGYTYEYVSPENFKLPGVFVSEGRLALDGPAYKAFVLSQIQNITVDAAQSLVDFARNGLPVVIAGGLPKGIPGFDAQNGSQNARVNDLIQQLTALPIVKVVADGNAIPDALQSLGVTPATTINPLSPSLYAIRRDESTASGTTTNIFLYNQNSSAINVTLTLSLGFNGTPFVLDPWSGTVSPVAVWRNTGNNIVIPGVSLAPLQSALFTVTSEAGFEGVPTPPVHITAADADVFAVSSSLGIEMRSFAAGSKRITLSNGRSQTVSLSLDGATTQSLTGWQLNITSWQPPQDLSQVDSVLVPHPPINLTQGLVPWDQLPGFANIAGVGTYMTTFNWNHGPTVGVQLDLGVVVHTLKAWLNGVQLTTADPTHPIVDISGLVRQGRNTLRVDAASTLVNAVNAVPQVTSLGQLRTLKPPNQHYGLIAPVRLIPYARATIAF